MVFHDSVDWGRDLQVMLDALVSKSMAMAELGRRIKIIDIIFPLFVSDQHFSFRAFQTASLGPPRAKPSCIPPSSLCHSTFQMRIWYTVLRN